MNLPEPRRFYPRRDFEEKAVIVHHGHFYHGCIYDIGEKGVQVGIPFEIDKLDSVVVSFFVRGNFISTLGVVRNCVNRNGEWRYGLEFTEIDFEDRRHIRQYVAHNSGDSVEIGNKKAV